MRDLNKFKGCLTGGAVGDALGYAVEFQSISSILSKYGSSGITEYELKFGKAEISDDTQMTMFTATGLLSGTTAKMTQGKMNRYSAYISDSYFDWLRTQNENYPLYTLSTGKHSSWLVNIPGLFRRRAPGNTCLSALRQGGKGTIEEPVNNSKGCGGVMRVAPIGLYFNDKGLSVKDIDMIGADAAALTHGHELGYIPAAALVHIIHKISECGCPIIDAVKDAAVILELFPNSIFALEFIRMLNRAIELSKKDLNDIEAIGELGMGWVAEETLAIAIYCALKYSDDFEKAIIASVNHSGDSDSTGAVTGNILGASLGYDAIPKKFTENLELKDVILELAEDLHHDCQTDEHGQVDSVWESKYVTVTYNGVKK